MNKDIMKQAGFKKEVELVENKQCPFCKADTTNTTFKDDLSLREYRISGICQECQDKTFGE